MFPVPVLDWRILMEEIYSETFLKAKPPVKRRMLRLGLLLLAVFALLFGVCSMLVMGTVLVFGVMIIAAAIIFFLLPTNDIAYEYIFVDGQIDYDCIYGGSKRKTLKRIDMSEVEVVAPENSHRLDSYKNLQLIDYSSGMPQDRHYIAVFAGEKGSGRIRFTPDDKMLQMMEFKSPSKVVKE